MVKEIELQSVYSNMQILI